MRTSADRIRNRLPTPADRQMQIDVDDTFVEVGQLPLHGLRTSLIVDPPDGLLPPLLPIANRRFSGTPTDEIAPRHIPHAGVPSAPIPD